MYQITCAGFYRIRNGGVYEVVYRRGSRWYGHEVYDFCGETRHSAPAMWEENGRWHGVSNETEWDIVGVADVKVLIGDAA